MLDEQSDQELIAWLEADEARSRKWRAQRLGPLLKAIPMPEEGMFFQGELSSWTFEEVRLAYVNGLYLSTVLLSLAFVEREIAGRLYAAGWNEAKNAKLVMLLTKAHETSVINRGEFDTFQGLRRIRNSIAHFHGPLASSSASMRTISEDKQPNEVFAEDAKRTIDALGTFLPRLRTIQTSRNDFRRRVFARCDTRVIENARNSYWLRENAMLVPGNVRLPLE